MFKVHAWWAGHKLRDYSANTRQEADEKNDEIQREFALGGVTLERLGMVFKPKELCVDIICDGALLEQHNPKR